MIEQGIVMLVQANASVLALCAQGGFFAELPKGQPLPTWTYLMIPSPPVYGLDTRPGLRLNQMQIDVYGAPESQGADCVALAKAIDDVLSGYAGQLPDPDATLCQGCFQTGGQDYFDKESESYRRMIEYEVCFSQ